MSRNGNFWGHHDVVQSPQYENYEVRHPDGFTMFFCNKKKIDWYLSRDLAEKIDDNTIRLKIVPKGVGNVNDPYFMQSFKNICVVCGSIEHLTRHHIVPKWYRKHFPEEVKSHRAYDVMPLCTFCHAKYEDCAHELKLKLAEKYDAPFHGIGMAYDSAMAHARGYANVILKFKHQIPAERMQKIEEEVKNYLGREPTEEDLHRLMQLKPIDYSKHIQHAQLVMAKVTDLDEFVQMWRRHFVETMSPKFMPQHWVVDRPADGVLRGEIL